MQPNAIFFDMDDTLLDGVSAMQGSWDAVCAEFARRLGCEPVTLRDAIRREGMEFWKDESKVEKEWRTRLAAAREVVVQRALVAEGLDASVAHAISVQYGEEHLARLRPFHDAEPTLTALKIAGYRLGLLTNGPKALQRAKIDRFQLEQHFQVIVIEEEFGVGKPDREVFEHGLRTLKARPEDSWHVGDNLYADISGAQRAGLHAVWIHRDRLEIREGAPAIPDRAIGHLDELLGALGCQSGAAADSPGQRRRSPSPGVSLAS